MSSVRTIRTLGLALGLAALAGCSGVGSPSSPVQPGADESYVFATITLLDLGSPCRPGVACAPEFYTCDGVTPITVPMSWTVRATTATAGTASLLQPTSLPASQAAVTITGTDTTRGTAVAVEFLLNAAGPTLDYLGGAGQPDPDAIYADVDTSCTRVNSAFNTVSQFQIVRTEPRNVTLGAAPVNGGNIEFATRNGASLTGGVLEGTFDFVGENRQELGQFYFAHVRVQGCFRVHITNGEQGNAVTPNPASPGC